MGQSASTEQGDFYMDPNSKIFPKTTILSLTTHGEIRLKSEVRNAADIKYDKDGLPTILPTFQVNENIREFYKFNAVVPGVVNYAGGNDDFGDIGDIEKSLRSKGGHEFADLIVGEEVSTVNNDVRNIIDKTPFLDRTNLDLLARDISQTVKRDFGPVKGKIQNYQKSLLAESKKEELDDDDELSLRLYTDFLNNYDKSLNVVNCLKDGNRKMVNKTFFLGSEDLSPGENWSITCLNYPFVKRNRIFEEVYNNSIGSKKSSTRKVRRSITLEQLVNYLAENGVERLIIIDLTCCPILGPYVDDPNVADTEYKGNTARMLRRDILTNGKGKFGGKSKHNKKTKKRRRISYKN
jgi:hypothetical protein